MTTSPQTLIAGESAQNLAAALRRIETTRCDDGTVLVNAKLEGEIGASLLRAVERYAADLVTADRLLDVEKRHADALVRIAQELADCVGTTGSDRHSQPIQQSGV